MCLSRQPKEQRFVRAKEYKQPIEDTLTEVQTGLDRKREETNQGLTALRLNKKTKEDIKKTIGLSIPRGE